MIDEYEEYDWPCMLKLLGPKKSNKAKERVKYRVYPKNRKPLKMIYC